MALTLGMSSFPSSPSRNHDDSNYRYGNLQIRSSMNNQEDFFKTDRNDFVYEVSSNSQNDFWTDELSLTSPSKERYGDTMNHMNLSKTINGIYPKQLTIQTNISGSQSNNDLNDYRSRLSPSSISTHYSTNSLINHQIANQDEINSSYDNLHLLNLPVITDANLYIKNIDYDITDDMLYNVFCQMGDITTHHIVRDSNKRSRGFGFM